MGVCPSLESAAWAGVRGDRRGKGPRHLGQNTWAQYLEERADWGRVGARGPPSSHLTQE